VPSLFLEERGGGGGGGGEHYMLAFTFNFLNVLNVNLWFFGFIGTIIPMVGSGLTRFLGRRILLICRGRRDFGFGFYSG
jgi:cellulose synthase/poly-beta-1,6-N-acetylglucosamine synthase-like glycosyltransferase